MLGKPVTQVRAWEACDTACPQVWSTGLPEQGWEEAPPAKGGLTAALAPARAVPGSQEWGSVPGPASCGTRLVTACIDPQHSWSGELMCP